MLKFTSSWILIQIPLFSAAQAEETPESAVEPEVKELTKSEQLVDGSLRAIRIGGGNESASAELKAEIQALNRRRNSILSSLAMLVHTMTGLGVDSREYRQLLLETGEVTTDLFDPEIVWGIVKKQLGLLSKWISSNAGGFATKLVIFLLILVVFRMIARATNFMMRRSFENQTVQVSKLMQDMLLGLSSKGIMILGYRPFDVGDIIEAGGVFGRVSKMSMVSTTILHGDRGPSVGCQGSLLAGALATPA